MCSRVEHPRTILEEAARVASHVFVEVPLEDHSRMRRDFVFDHVGHINFYSPRTDSVARAVVQPARLAADNEQPVEGDIHVPARPARRRRLPDQTSFVAHGAKLCGETLLIRIPAVHAIRLTQSYRGEPPAADLVTRFAASTTFAAVIPNPS